MAEVRPDRELVDDRLGDGEFVVRAHCVGHPLRVGSGCGWTGTAKRQARVMPVCPECGGWAEPDAPQGGLRGV